MRSLLCKHIFNMSYHKENLKERLAEIAWEICEAESWQKINMRLVAQKAGVSPTAFYRHFQNKNDLKAELMRRGYQLINQGMKDLNVGDNFASYGAHVVRFGLDHPHIYDLMFESNDLDRSRYPDLEALSMASFNGIVKGIRGLFPHQPKRELMLKAYNIWSSTMGLVTILRHSKQTGKRTETIEWIENNLEEYLMMTTFR